MHFTAILLIAFGLAMDAFAVSIARGMGSPSIDWNKASLTALIFGSFQAGMPVLGWYSCLRLGQVIRSFDHWIAFVLLGGIGIKMIWESGGTLDLPKENSRQGISSSLPTLLLLGLATSIDALATGVSFSLLNVEILIPVLLIGITTFLLSLFGVRFGARCGHFMCGRVELVGGLILIALGTKILVDHLGFAAFV